MFSIVLFKIFIVLVYFIDNSLCQSVTPNHSLCGTETEISLQGSGVNSSVILTLDRADAMTTTLSTCKLRISAPESHIIYINVIEEDLEESGTKEDTSSSQEEDNSCLLSVYVPENHRSAVWRSNPCTQSQIPEGPLVPHQARIVWNIENNPRPKHGRKLVLTALSQREDCLHNAKHVCLKVGWTPIACISEDLVCDGIPNCPGGGKSDEETQLCKDKKQKNSWEKLANEFLKKFAGKTNAADFLPTTSNYDTIWLKETFFKVTTERLDKRYRKDTDTLAGLLSRYGPWGYLMLGMLICGTTLMVCGLWECCCRKTKSINRQSSRQVSSAPQSTTVLIINPNQGSTDQSDEVNQLPPNYDDLDQPPSYSTLFPANK